MLPPPLVQSDSEDDFTDLEAELASHHFISSLKLLTGDSVPQTPSNQSKVHLYASDKEEEDLLQGGDSGASIPGPTPERVKSVIRVNTSYIAPASREEAVESATDVILTGMADEYAKGGPGGQERMLAMILEKLEGLSRDQKALEAKVDTLIANPSPRHAQSDLEPSSYTSTQPYTSFQAPATPTHPSHLSLTYGAIPAQSPATANHTGRKISFGGFGIGGGLSGLSSSGSALSTSYEGKHGGGIEALELARRHSRPATPHALTPSGGPVNAKVKQTQVGFVNLANPEANSGTATPEPAPASPIFGEPDLSPTLEDVGKDEEMPGNAMWQLDLAADRLKAKESGGRNGIAERKERKLEEVYGRRAILTSYPGQPGVRPYPLHWNAGPDPRLRGPIICSRQPASLPYRNAIGAHTGPYSVYRALSVAMKLLPVDHRPDFTDTSPPISIGPHQSWWETDGSGMPKIVSMDPFGALAQEIWKKEYDEGLDIRPTISQTKSHLKISELDTLYKEGKLEVDGNIVMNSPELPAFPGVHQGIQVATYKISVDPVWYLPGIAARLKVEEGVLRRALFEDTGGMYPELLTRPDLQVYLPPIGGITIYIFGDPAHLSDPSKELTFRPHDECNGSDVFGSDICTCRPYLTHGIFEAVKTAKRGGVGCIAYFRKEGRALGEVTKLLVYNLRKRTGDSAERYFKSTELIAGIKDQRFQALHLPDVLAYLGITKIDNLISMSDMKYNAMVQSGVKVINRYEIPEELMPPDSLVEIHAKINHGYFSNKKVDDEALKLTRGRGWEDIVH